MTSQVSGMEYKSSRVVESSSRDRDVTRRKISQTADDLYRQSKANVTETEETALPTQRETDDNRP